VNRAKNTAKDFTGLTICILSLAAIFYFDNVLYNYIATGIAVLVVGMLSNDRRENFPILLFVLVVQVVELLTRLLPAEAMLLKLTAVSLLDLLLAFFIVHYHKDPALYKFFKVHEPAKRVPQVYLLSLALAVTSLFSFLMAAEVMLFYVDENIFQGTLPFFHGISNPVRLACKIMFDLAIWSMLLNPDHWRFLRRIEQRFDL
jgi:hypothetical protein